MDNLSNMNTFWTGICYAGTDFVLIIDGDKGRVQQIYDRVRRAYSDQNRGDAKSLIV